MRFVLILLAATIVNTAMAAATPRQRVVISDNYTSWLLKGEGSERYGEGEALPKLLAEGWTIASVTAGCESKSHTIYVLNAPIARTAPSALAPAKK
jgi:hypothetical protein